MKRALFAALLLPALAGCGGGGGALEQRPAASSHRAIAALGFALELPRGWEARILIGAAGRPVLHAANFPLPSNDDDSGEVARETIGRDQMYLNARDLGPGETRTPLPLAFHQSEFGPPPPGPGSRCCVITVASRDVSASGHDYRLTVISGSSQPPPLTALAPLNALLSTLALKPYEPNPSPPAPAGEQLAGYGIKLNLARGWDGRVSPGVVEAASSRLPADAELQGPLSIGRDDVVLRLVEHGGSDAAFVTARLPLQLAPTEFIAPGPGSGGQGTALTGRSFVANGRQFVLWALAGSLPPNVTALTEANEALATLRIEPGDLYPGRVESATFAPAPGWDTGSSGPAKIEPDGEYTSSWAATVAYRDPPNQFPPHHTLDALPPDGIAIVAWVTRNPGRRSELPPGRPPFELAHANQGQFEGVPSDRATYQIAAHVPGRFDVTLWVFFGSAHPTRGQLDRAQAELDRLQLPDR